MTNSTPEAALAEVEALLERNRTAQAKERLKQALQEYPEHQELLLQYGWVYYLEDNNDAALATVQHVLAQYPDSTRARTLLFKVLEDLNRLPEAEQVMVDLLKDYPESAPYYGWYAKLMIRALLLPKARALAEEGLHYDPDESGCLSARLLCDFIEQRREASTHSLQQLLVRHPEALRTMGLLLLMLQERGDYRGALRIAQELLRAQPGNTNFLEAVLELKAATHWSMLPLWPLQRWGWGASVGLWLFGVVTVRLLAQTDRALAGYFALCLIAYVIYSWVWPPLLRRWVAR